MRKYAQKVLAALSRTLAVMESKEGGVWLRETWCLMGEQCVCAIVCIWCVYCVCIYGWCVCFALKMET